MKIMFCILGDGRGHMTQAIAAKEILERAGHRVVSVVLGLGPGREPPAFFRPAMQMPVHTIATLEFRYGSSGRVNSAATLTAIARRLPMYFQSLRKLREIVRDTKSDLILNFFEPLTGIYAAMTRRRPPVVAIAHHFMYGHPRYLRAPGRRLQQFGMKWYIRLVGSASTRLALSMYEAPDLPRKDLVVSPPLLRRPLFELQPNPNGDFVLVYLLSHGYAGQIIEWHRRNPETVLHCFYDKPGAPAEFQHDATLTFHRLDGEKFLRLMAQCRYVACTAGFESLCEAAYLGKPLFLVPVENHIEQQINALDATRIGWGITDSRFNLDRLVELPDRTDNARYRAWLHRADSILLRTTEDAVAGARKRPRSSRRWRTAESNAA